MNNNPALEVLFPNRKIKTRSQNLSEKNSPQEIEIERSPINSPPPFALRNLPTRDKEATKAIILPAKKSETVITSRPLFSIDSKDRSVINIGSAKELTKKHNSPPPLRTQAIMKAIMGNVSTEPGNKFHSKYQAKPSVNEPKLNTIPSSNPVEKLTQEVQNRTSNTTSTGSLSHAPTLLAPSSKVPIPQQPTKAPTSQAPAVPPSSVTEPTSTPPSTAPPLLPQSPSPLINNPMSGTIQQPPQTQQQPQPQPQTPANTQQPQASIPQRPGNTPLRLNSSDRTTSPPIQPRLLSVFPSISTIPTERIVYINDALSGLHGGKLKSLAQDLYRSRRAVYEHNKRKLDDSNLHDLLEQHADEYMKWQYQTKYSVLENPFVPAYPAPFQHFTFEKSEQARPTMQDAIASLRQVNLNIAKSHNKYAVRYESSSVLGKRTPLLADVQLGLE